MSTRTLPDKAKLACIRLVYRRFSITTLWVDEELVISLTYSSFVGASSTSVSSIVFPIPSLRSPLCSTHSLLIVESLSQVVSCSLRQAHSSTPHLTLLWSTWQGMCICYVFSYKCACTCSSPTTYTCTCSYTLTEINVGVVEVVWH